MDVRQAIEKRRAYRSLLPVDITPELLEKMATAASLAPSCFNKQPWRFVAVHDKDMARGSKNSSAPGISTYSM